MRNPKSASIAPGVELDRKNEAQARRLGVVAGTPVEISIQTGKGSMLSYITKPLRDHLSRAMRDG